MTLFDNINISEISIHTPTKGVTEVSEEKDGRRKNFNPHSHKGVTQFSGLNPYADFISIHTPTKGVTSGLPPSCSTSLISIHTPTKGVTLCSATLPLLQEFQSTLPQRE